MSTNLGGWQRCCCVDITQIPFFPKRAVSSYSWIQLILQRIFEKGYRSSGKSSQTTSKRQIQIRIGKIQLVKPTNSDLLLWQSRGPGINLWSSLPPETELINVSPLLALYCQYHHRQFCFGLEPWESGRILPPLFASIWPLHTMRHDQSLKRPPRKPGRPGNRPENR